MFNGYRRWYVLTALALGNFVLWVTIAAVAGLLVSDRVDVGLETELRQGRATAIAIWKGLPKRGLEMPGHSTAQLGGSQPPSSQPQPTTGANPAEPLPSPTDGPAQDDPTTTAPPAASATPPAGGATPSRPASATDAPASEPAAVEPPANADKPANEKETVSATAPPTPEPTQVLLTRPLLLADPEFHSLASLNAELARSAPGRVVQIRYRETTLNQEIATMCENNPDLPFRNVHADLKRDQVVLTGEITVLSFQVEARVTGTIVARDCRPQIEIEAISMAGVLTPRFVRNQIEQTVLDAMTWYPADYPLCLEQIVLEETRATLYGYHR